MAPYIICIKQGVLNPEADIQLHRAMQKPSSFTSVSEFCLGEYGQSLVAVYLGSEAQTEFFACSAKGLGELVSKLVRNIGKDKKLDTFQIISGDDPQKNPKIPDKIK